MRRFSFLLICLVCQFSISQQFSSNVIVNSESLNQTNNSVFKNLEQSIIFFVDKNQWSNDNLKDFEKIDMRVCTIIKAVEFKKASNPSYLIHVDFGEIGIKKTSAQITKNYKLKDLIGKQIVGLVNLPKKQILIVED